MSIRFVRNLCTVLWLGVGAIGLAAAQQATATPTPTVTFTPTPTATPLPCEVQGEGATLRVGPGPNRGVYAAMPDDAAYPVVGAATANDDTRWFRIDKDALDPGIAANEIWVAAEDVTPTGGCDAIGVVPTPGVIIAQPTSTATPTPMLVRPGMSTTPDEPEGATVMFSADDNAITAGACTRLQWRTENIREVYYQGRGVPGNGSAQECPTTPATYTLRVIFRDGTSQTYSVRVDVAGSGQAAPQPENEVVDTAPTATPTVGIPPGAGLQQTEGNQLPQIPPP